MTAEYANYRKRVDRDREKAAEKTIGAVLTSLLPVLDDIDRAREHGDLVGPFASVAESLTTVTGKLGLTGVRREGRPVRPEPARGGRAPDVGATSRSRPASR